MFFGINWITADENIGFKAKTSCLGLSIFSFVFASFYECGLVGFSRPITFLIMLFVASLTVVAHIIFAPISWNQTFNKFNLSARLLISSLSCFAIIATYVAVITLVVAKNFGYTGSYSDSFFNGLLFHTKMQLIPMVGIGFIVSSWKQSEEKYESTKVDLKSMAAELELARKRIEFSEKELATSEAELASTRAELTSTKGELASTTEDLISTKTKLESTEGKLTFTEEKLLTVKGNLSFAKSVLDSVQEKLKCAKATMLVNEMDDHALQNIFLHCYYKAIKEGAEKTADHILAAKDYFCSIRKAARTGTIYMEDEREILEDYINIRCDAFFERLKLEWHWDENLDGLELPPFILLPLVENAIKHGVYLMQGGTLKIIYERVPSGLRIGVVNSVPTDGKEYSLPFRESKVGIKNLKDRLRLAFGDNARYELVIQDGWATADVLIDNSVLDFETLECYFDTIPIDNMFDDNENDGLTIDGRLVQECN